MHGPEAGARHRCLLTCSMLALQSMVKLHAAVVMCAQQIKMSPASHPLCALGL